MGTFSISLQFPLARIHHFLLRGCNFLEFDISRLISFLFFEEFRWCFCDTIVFKTPKTVWFWWKKNHGDIITCAYGSSGSCSLKVIFSIFIWPKFFEPEFLKCWKKFKTNLMKMWVPKPNQMPKLTQKS